MTKQRMPYDPDPDIVHREFPGSRVIPSSAGGWVARWNGHTYTGKSPEGLASKMRSGQHFLSPGEQAADTRT